MRKKYFCLFFLSLMICLSAFAKGKKSKVNYPSWITEPHSKYNSDYFVAVGNEKSKNFAELRAVEELAGIFGKDVNSSTIAESSMTRIEQEHVSSLVEEQNLNQQILVNVDQRNLVAVEIAETFYDENKGDWYALAVLDKKKAAKIYLKEIQTCYKTIDDYCIAIEKSDNDFDKLGYTYKCKNTAQYIQSLIIRLQVIDFGVAEATKRTDISVNRFNLEFDNIANSIPISIRINQDNNDIIKSACTEVFESYGFKISTQADCILEIVINNSYRTVTKPAAIYCESVMTISLNTNDDKIIFPFNHSSRAGGKNEELAIKKEYSQLQNAIQTEYKKSIEEFLLQEK